MVGARRLTQLVLLTTALGCCSKVVDAGAVTGIMYEGWHAPAYWGRSTSLMESKITVEDVIRSDGRLSMANISSQLTANASGFWWHKEPLDGFYCIYRKRDSENVSSCGLPDCPNITETLTRHARLLTDAGIDFVVADSTNLQTTGAFADAIQLRPWQVLAEEWLKLRQRGVSTPRIAIWQNLADAKGDLWKQYIENEYSDPKYDDLIFTDSHTQKKVFFTTANPTDALVKAIESTQKITVVTMWALRNNFAQGEWAFFSPCTTTTTTPPTTTTTTATTASSSTSALPSNTSYGNVQTRPTINEQDPVLSNASLSSSSSSSPWSSSSSSSKSSSSSSSSSAFTSSVWSDPAIKCNQHVTTNSKIGQHGTSITIGPSYQLSYTSVPFRASGKLGGLTIRKQFEQAFIENAKGTLDYLMVGTFNEHIAQPQPNHFPSFVKSMGLENDPFASNLWVDMFGDGISRDLEPTVQDGGKAWNLFLSCKRVFDSGASTCANLSEPCCNVQADPGAKWLNVWALHSHGDEGDHLLTVLPNERQSLIAQGWAEVCSEAGGASAFCAWNNDPNAAAPNASSYTGGPFLIHPHQLEPSNASRPLFRCITSKGYHFVSNDPACNTQGKQESLLGYVASSRCSNHPRSLRSCQLTQPNGETKFYHSLDAACGSGSQELLLGFVH